MKDDGILALAPIFDYIDKHLPREIYDTLKYMFERITEVVGPPVDIRQMGFFLHTSEDKEYDDNNIDPLNPIEIAQTNGMIYFLIHGWSQSRKNTPWYRPLTEILLEQNPRAHVVQVDWSEPAAPYYSLAAFNTESVGNHIANLIYKLIEEYEIPLEKIVVIGHSLGGQIAGWIGKKFFELTNVKLPRIIALDPAAPLFRKRIAERRLNKHDAEVVQVVHSGGMKLGFAEPCGTIDFFPNGGISQPDCGKIDFYNLSSVEESLYCSHQRSYEFFVKAVKAPDEFMAEKCKDYDHFKQHECEDIHVSLGDLKTMETGLFDLVDTYFKQQFSEDDVNLYIYTPKTFGHPRMRAKIETIAKTNGTIFYIVHGYQVNGRVHWYKTLSDAIIEKYPDSLVAQVDWEKFASGIYFLPASYTKDVANKKLHNYVILKLKYLGTKLARMIKGLVYDHGVASDRIVLIGHSLGAQICGWAGRKYIEMTGKKLSRIVALDPAQPLFKGVQLKKRLNRNDAMVVMVIHTDAILGYAEPCGTIDFFANGGRFQPGCLEDLSLKRLLTCSHRRAYQYFIEALKKPEFFMAKGCHTLKDCQKLKTYENADSVSLGDMETNKTGLYFLKTSKYPPYYIQNI
ncbi:hypothetical protein HHI36_002642 [Cryptolaemus montrouzieri]|uniref:Lipase domain-containing protein n=1 Tax=Cryptolaemus montrouzieri TaxID=559131 RepID=A0ABD2PBW2_9CUCU